MMELLLSLVAGGGVAFVAYDRFRVWNMVREAKKASCPVCGSRDLDGIVEDDLYDAEFLEDDFQCRDCGIRGGAIDGFADRELEVLKRLQSIGINVADIRDQTAISSLLLGNSDDHQDFQDTTSRLRDIWEELATLSDDYPEVFALETDHGSRSLEAFVRDHWKPEAAPSGSLALTDAGRLQQWRQLRDACDELENALDALQSTIANDLSRRQKGEW